MFWQNTFDYFCPCPCKACFVILGLPTGNVPRGRHGPHGRQTHLNRVTSSRPTGPTAPLKREGRRRDVNQDLVLLKVIFVCLNLRVSSCFFLVVLKQIQEDHQEPLLCFESLEV